MSDMSSMIGTLKRVGVTSKAVSSAAAALESGGLPPELIGDDLASAELASLASDVHAGTCGLEDVVRRLGRVEAQRSPAVAELRRLVARRQEAAARAVLADAAAEIGGQLATLREAARVALAEADTAARAEGATDRTTARASSVALAAWERREVAHGRVKVMDRAWSMATAAGLIPAKLIDAERAAATARAKQAAAELVAAAAAPGSTSIAFGDGARPVTASLMTSASTGQVAPKAPRQSGRIGALLRR